MVVLVAREDVLREPIVRPAIHQEGFKANVELTKFVLDRLAFTRGFEVAVMIMRRVTPGARM